MSFQLLLWLTELNDENTKGEKKQAKYLKYFFFISWHLINFRERIPLMTAFYKNKK
jgi:hypothetical protein